MRELACHDTTQHWGPSTEYFYVNSGSLSGSLSALDKDKIARRLSVIVRLIAMDTTLSFK